MNKESIKSVLTLLTIPSLLLAAPGLAAEQSPVDRALVISMHDKSLQWGPCPEFIPAGCQIAVLQGDPAGPNADIFFRVPGDFHIPYHRHTSRERMVLVSGELEVTYDNHEKALIRTGEFAYGPAQLPHEAYCRPGDPCVLYIGFVAPVDAMPVEKE